MEISLRRYYGDIIAEILWRYHYRDIMEISLRANECFSNTFKNLKNQMWAYGVVVSMFDFHCSTRVRIPVVAVKCHVYDYTRAVLLASV